HRQQHGGFKTVDGLAKVSGIGPSTLERVRPWVTLGDEADDEEEEAVPPADRKDKPLPATRKQGQLKEAIDVNRAPLADLQKLPGIGPKISQRIVDERARRPFAKVDDLRRVAGIGPKTLENVRPFVTVGEKGGK